MLAVARHHVRTAALVATLSAVVGGAGVGLAAPDAGTLSILGDPCFGAASRAPGRLCQSPVLRGAVVPSPQRARIFVPAACDPLPRTGALFACGWGAPAATATRTVALLGDSHAAHWRPAVERVARRLGWRGVSMSRPGCPITTAVPKLPTQALSLDCMRWNRAVQRWLAERSQITVVFVSQHRGTVRPPPGQSSAAARQHGYLRAWRRMLADHVRHVIVLRDVPRATPGTLGCVARAIAADRLAGPACAVPRRYALPPDPAAVAAGRPGTASIQVADLSDVFCSPRLCPPVIGGALVHRDTQHLTRLFARSLGPLLLVQVRRLTAAWRDRVTPAARPRAPRAHGGRARPSRPRAAARRW